MPLIATENDEIKYDTAFFQQKSYLKSAFTDKNNPFKYESLILGNSHTQK